MVWLKYMKKTILAFIVLVIIIVGLNFIVPFLPKTAVAPVATTTSEVVVDKNLDEEIEMRPARLISVDLSKKTIEAVEVQTSAQYTISADKARVYSYTDNPDCDVSCEQPESLTKIDNKIKNKDNYGFEIKGRWVNINGQNIFQASEIGWKY